MLNHISQECRKCWDNVDTWHAPLTWCCHFVAHQVITSNMLKRNYIIVLFVGKTCTLYINECWSKTLSLYVEYTPVDLNSPCFQLCWTLLPLTHHPARLCCFRLLSQGRWVSPTCWSFVGSTLSLLLHVGFILYWSMVLVELSDVLGHVGVGVGIHKFQNCWVASKKFCCLRR